MLVALIITTVYCALVTLIETTFYCVKKTKRQQLHFLALSLIEENNKHAISRYTVCCLQGWENDLFTFKRMEINWLTGGQPSLKFMVILFLCWYYSIWSIACYIMRFLNQLKKKGQKKSVCTVTLPEYL